MEKGNGAKNGMNELIGNTLRIGVFAACIIALVGGIYYLATTSGHPVPDYTAFHKGAVSYTTFEGIIRGAFSLSATEWMQLGVVVLMLTPIMRVVLSLVDFSIQRDWLYVAITAIVLVVIIVNSLVGVG